MGCAVAVVGLRVGGQEVALRLAEAGWSVLGTEQVLVDGECPYWACVPAKAMTRAARALGAVDRSGWLTGTARVEPGWKVLAGRVRQVAEGWDDDRAVSRCCRRTSRRTPPPWRNCCNGTASRYAPESPRHRSAAAVTRSVSHSPTARRCAPSACSWRPGDGPISGRSAWRRPASRHGPAGPHGRAAAGRPRGPGRRRRHRARGQFTHVAYYQAQIAAADILGTDHEPADYAAVPRVTFADPEVGSVGEAEARRRGLTFRVGVLPTSASDRAWLYGPGADLGVLELVEDVRTGTLLGGASFGPAAGETAALLALALRARSPVAVLNEVICPYPTFARAIRGALCRLA